MKHSLIELLQMISDHGSALASKSVNIIGGLSVGSGATLGAVAASNPQIIEQSSLPMIAAVVSIIGGITFIMKNIFDMYLSWRRRDKDK